MKTSPPGRRLIAKFESFEPKPYNDPAGYCTIGIGHLIAKRRCTPGDRDQWGTLTEQQALELLASDLPRYEEPITRLVKVPLNQNQFDALASFVFNVGPENFRSSTLLRLLNAGDYAGAASEFGKWNKARVNGVLRVLPGLTKRRAEEAAFFRSTNVAAPAPTSNKPAPTVAARSRVVFESDVVRGSQETEAVIDFLEASGVPARITSVVRSSLPSRHAQRGTGGKGLAVDAGGLKQGRNTPEMLAIFKAFEPVEDQLYELIYSGAPYSIKRGKRVARFAIDDHWDHVHIAVDKGVIIRWPWGQEDEMQRVVRTTKTDGSEWPGRYLTDDLAVSYIGTGSRLEDLEARFGQAQPMPRQDFDQLVKINGSVGWPE